MFVELVVGLGLAVAPVVFEGPVFVIDQVIVAVYLLYLGAALNILASGFDLTGQVLASFLVVVKAEALSVLSDYLVVLAIFEDCLQLAEVVSIWDLVDRSEVVVVAVVVVVVVVAVVVVVVVVAAIVLPV
jgi:hypothetical protein